MTPDYFKNLPSEQEIHKFRNSIVRWWFGNNKRHYLWRETDDPFRLLIAEIMLRRTNADQVEKVYIDLFKNYPDSYSMSKADGKKVELFKSGKNIFGYIFMGIAASFTVPFLLSIFSRVVMSEGSFGKSCFAIKTLNFGSSFGGYTMFIPTTLTGANKS